MNTLHATLGHRPPHRHAASLSQVIGWKLAQFGQWIERAGQRRAAPEIARAAERLALTHPGVAADLADQARRWRDA